MTHLENIITRIRHESALGNMGILWNLVRPIHDFGWRLWAWRGISRNLNGTEPMRISPRLRQLSDEYEPEVWRSLMGQVKAGDTFADIGSFHGLYAVAVGKRAARPAGFMHLNRIRSILAFSRSISV
jgi:hypothetical protein